MRRLLLWTLAALLLVSTGAPGAARAAKEELIIGITQFPDTLNPIINAMLAKSYVLAMVRRPFTTYDQNWELVCMLCTELPTIENGLAKRETLEDGREGIAVTFEIQPDATWGDGTPVTTRDVVFGWEVGRHPLTGVANAPGGFGQRGATIGAWPDGRRGICWKAGYTSWRLACVIECGWRRAFGGRGRSNR